MYGPCEAYIQLDDMLFVIPVLEMQCTIGTLTVGLLRTAVGTVVQC
jgi:hypothetical protein